MLNKHLGCKKGEANQKQQFLTIHVTKSFDISQGQELANYRYSKKVASCIT